MLPYDNSENKSSQQSEQHPYEKLQIAILNLMAQLFKVFEKEEPVIGARSMMIYKDMQSIIESPNLPDVVLVLQQVSKWLNPVERKDGWWSGEHTIIQVLINFKEQFHKTHGSIQTIALKKIEYEKALHKREEDKQALEKKNNLNDVKELLKEELDKVKEENKKELDNLKLQGKNAIDRITIVEGKNEELTKENKLLSQKAEGLEKKVNVGAEFMILLFNQNQTAFLESYKAFEQQNPNSIEYLPKIPALENGSVNDSQAKSKNNTNTNTNSNENGCQDFKKPAINPSISSTPNSALLPQSHFSQSSTTNKTDPSKLQSIICPYILADLAVYDRSFFQTRYTLIIQLKSLCTKQQSQEVIDQVKLAIRLLLLLKYSKCIQEVKSLMIEKIPNLNDKILAAFGDKDDGEKLLMVPPHICKQDYVTYKEVQDISILYKNSSAYGLPEDTHMQDICGALWRSLNNIHVDHIFTFDEYFTNYITPVTNSNGLHQ